MRRCLWGVLLVAVLALLPSSAFALASIAALLVIAQARHCLV